MPGTDSNSGRCSLLYHSLNSCTFWASISTYTMNITQKPSFWQCRSIDDRSAPAPVRGVCSRSNAAVTATGASQRLTITRLWLFELEVSHHDFLRESARRRIRGAVAALVAASPGLRIVEEAHPKVEMKPLASRRRDEHVLRGVG